MSLGKNSENPLPLGGEGWGGGAVPPVALREAP